MMHLFAATQQDPLLLLLFGVTVLFLLAYGFGRIYLMFARPDVHLKLEEQEAAKRERAFGLVGGLFKFFGKR